MHIHHLPRVLLPLGFAVLSPAAASGQDRPAMPPPVPTVSPTGAAGAFMARLPTHPGVDRELARFDEGRLPAPYREAFAEAARTRIGAEVRALLDGMLREGCAPAVSVEFPGEEFSGLPGRTEVRDDFEDSIVLTRSVACYETSMEPAPLLALYASRAVRMEAQSRMKDVYQEEGLTCYDVGGVPILLAPTRSCNQVTRHEAKGIALEHSQSVWSEAEDHQPVYFKESVKAALALRGDRVGLVHVTVTRSTGLGGLEKRLGRGRIEDSLRGQTAVLAEHIAREATR